MVHFSFVVARDAKNVVGFQEFVNTGSLTDEEFLHYLSNYQLLKKHSAP
jgi:hypothetical protein